MEHQLSIVHTPCKSCVFAEYDENTQTGCRLNYIEKYKENGEQILEAYDDNKEFYIINGKKCVGYRENQWFAQYGLENASLEEKEKKFRESNHIDYVLVVNFIEIGDSDQDIANIKRAFSSLGIHPAKIVFVRGPEGSKTTIYASIQKLMADSKIDCKWRIQTMVDDSISNENILHGVITENKSYRFVCHMKKSSCNNLNNVVEAANDIVYSQLNKFIVLTDPDNSCVLFGSGVYRFSLAEHGKDILADTGGFKIV
jgi:hypothetical protein